MKPSMWERHPLEFAIERKLDVKTGYLVNLANEWFEVGRHGFIVCLNEGIPSGITSSTKIAGGVKDGFGETVDSGKDGVRYESNIGWLVS